MKEPAQIAFEQYALYLRDELGENAICTWENTSETIRTAWRRAVAMPLEGPGRVWKYNNYDYTWQKAMNIDELKALPWVQWWFEQVPTFHRLSVSSSGKLRAPWDRSAALTTLIYEYNTGCNWAVIGGLETPELYNLPEWVYPGDKSS